MRQSIARTQFFGIAYLVWMKTSSFLLAAERTARTAATAHLWIDMWIDVWVSQWSDANSSWRRNREGPGRDIWMRLGRRADFSMIFRKYVDAHVDKEWL